MRITTLSFYLKKGKSLLCTSKATALHEGFVTGRWAKVRMGEEEEWRGGAEGGLWG